MGRTVTVLGCVLLLMTAGVACDLFDDDPSDQVLPVFDLTGQWDGSNLWGPCGEDWSSVTFFLEQYDESVTGSLATGEGVTRSVQGTVGTEMTIISVGDLPGSSECYSFQLVVEMEESEYDRSGQLVEVSGVTQGRCCGTVAGEFVLSRHLDI